MNMNILEQEDLIKGAPDDLLLQEAQSPTGRVPQFLVVSEIQRRKSMRDRFSAQEQQPEQSVAEQIVAGAASQMPPQGIGALQPQMPPPLPQMPQQAPVMAMPPPQMPPEMMAAQNAPMAPPPQMMAAGGGRMPYQRMNHGGVIPPNALVEDASKFDSESLNDMRDSEKGWGSPKDMGIPRVIKEAASSVRDAANIRNIGFDGRNITGSGSFMLPNGLELGASGYAGSGGAGITGLDAFKELQNNRFIRGQVDPLNKSFGLQFGGSFPGLNQGGLVRMANGQQVETDDDQSFFKEVKEMGADASTAVKEYYSDPDGSPNWSKIGLHGATALFTFTPAGWFVKSAQLAKGAYGGIRAMQKAKSFIPPSVQTNLGTKIAQQLKLKGPGRGNSKKDWYGNLIRENPSLAAKFAGESAIKSLPSGITRIGGFVKRNPKKIGIGTLYGTQSFTGAELPFMGGETEEVKEQVSASVGNITENVAAKAAADRARKIEYIRNRRNINNNASGGIIQMQSGSKVPLDNFDDMSDEEINALYTKAQADADAQAKADAAGAVDLVDLDLVVDPADAEADAGTGTAGVGTAEADAGTGTGSAAGNQALTGSGVNLSNNTNQQLLDMMAESRGNIKDISSRFKDIKGPDYETLKAGIREGVDEDVLSSILMSMAKSIYEGKGLAGADVSGAQKIRQRAKDAMNAITLAESRGASERELADLNRELQTEISLMAPFSALQAPPKTAITNLRKLQNELAALEQADPDNPQIIQHQAAIARITSPTRQGMIMDLVAKMGTGKMEKGKLITGVDLLDAADKGIWNALIEGNIEFVDRATESMFKEGGLVREADGIYRSVN